MQARKRSLMVFLVALLATTPMLAHGAEPVSARAAGSESEAPAQPRPLPVRTSPLMDDIRRVLDEEKAARAALEDRLAKTADDTQALALQQELEALKRGTEVRVLEVQAHHARLAGRMEQAKQIDAAIEKLKNPPPPARLGADAKLPPKGASLPPANASRR